MQRQKRHAVLLRLGLLVWVIVVEGVGRLVRLLVRLLVRRQRRRWLR